MATGTRARKLGRDAARGVAIVVAISLVTLLVALLVASLLAPWEAVACDLRMRWRYTLAAARGRDAHSRELVLVAIDTRAQDEKGRYPAGEWRSRKAYFDQLTAFEEYFRPTVLAYDILFHETAGRDGGRHAVRVSESPETLRTIAEDLDRVAGNARDMLPMRTLFDMDRLASEQGDTIMAHRLASIAENGCFDMVVGYAFRGGGVDKQVVAIPPWSADDVCGGDPKGDENRGRTIPYLTDMAIPEEDIHFATPAQAERYDYSPNAALPSRELLDYVSLGALNAPKDADGVVRRVPLVLGFQYRNPVTGRLVRRFVPTFSLLTTLLHLGVDVPLQPGAVVVRFGRSIDIRRPDGSVIHVPIDDRGNLFVNFEQQEKDFDAISLAALSPSRLDTTEAERDACAHYRRNINGRIAVVGVTVTGLDVGATPLRSNVSMVYVQMSAMSNILSGRFIRPPGNHVIVLLHVLLVALLTSICIAVRGPRLVVVALLMIVGYATLAYAGVHVNWTVLPLIGPLVYIGLCTFGVISYRYLTEERGRRRIRGMFSAMVSGQVLSFLEEHPDSVSLEGATVDATVLFSDIVDFTRMSEHLPANRVTTLLNRYFAPVTNSILESEGYLDKYIGDAVMAVWGAPYADPEHAVKACRVALAQQDLLRGLNADLEREYGLRLAVRMGINSGPMTAAAVGSVKKFQYTVMGDAVNLAARLEPLNRDLGTRIILGDTTYRLAGGAVVTRMLGLARVKGRQTAEPIHELLGMAGAIADVDIPPLIELYETAWQAFTDRRWTDCIRALDELLALRPDGPSLVLRERARELQAHPPPPEWTPVYAQLHK